MTGAYEGRLFLEASMLELVCYLLALVFALLAVLGPPHPALDRVRLLAASFAAFVIPALVHAAQGV